MSSTIREYIIAALVRNGEREVKRLHKRDVYTRKGFTDFNFYVGHAGSLRSGRTFGASVPVTNKLKQQLIEQGKQIIQERRKPT